MKFLFISFVLFLLLQSCYTSEEHTYKSNVKILSPDEFSKIIFRNNGTDAGVETTLAKQLTAISPYDGYIAIPPDNGYGNYGDLIHRSREDGDTLILREVIVLPFLTSSEQDVHWSASTHASRISSVRVLNFGRERAYTTRIDVAGNDVQLFFLVPSHCDPRIMIEIYGF